MQKWWLVYLKMSQEEMRISCTQSFHTSKQKALKSVWCTYSLLQLRLKFHAIYASTLVQISLRWGTCKSTIYCLCVKYWFIFDSFGARQFIKKPVVCKMSSVEGNLFTFGLICYICQGGQKTIFARTNISKYLTSKHYVWEFYGTGKPCQKTMTEQK